MVFVSSSEVADCSVHAIERQFPWIRVAQIASLAAACAPSEYPAALILIDNAMLGELSAHMPALQMFHPAAAFAILQGETSQAVAVAEMFAHPQMRGVLPMYLKLDLWLSILQLLLQGGIYVPPPIFAATAPSMITPSAFDRRASDTATASRKELGVLTEREFQILELVSHGLQNKSIAVRLGLSENTIKIHLHNIITKLGVHNRTEAAGLFRMTPVAGSLRAHETHSLPRQP